MTEATEARTEFEGTAVYPPSFCRWRQLLAVAVITEVSVVLVGLGRGGMPGWSWFGMASVYALWLAYIAITGQALLARSPSPPSA